MKENRLPYNKTGFKIPEGYFQDFQSRLMERVTRNEEDFGASPFKVPESYFEQFGDRVFENLENSSEKGKVIPLYRRKTWSYIAGVAAVVAILFSSVLFNDHGELGFEDLDITAVENYLLESFNMGNPSEAPYMDYELTASANYDIDREALFEYLNENIEEPALLLNED